MWPDSGRGVGRSWTFKFSGPPNASITTAFIVFNPIDAALTGTVRQGRCLAHPAGTFLRSRHDPFNRIRAARMSILHEIATDGIMVVTLNRPDKLNALDV